MPSPQDGKAGTIVPPADPVEPHPADDAVPGAVESEKAAQRESYTGKYGSTPFPPHDNTPPKSTDKTSKKVWVEIQLVDDVNKPVPGAKYTVTTKDGTVYSSTTGADGVGRVENLDPGTVDICFTELDQDAWEPV